MVKPVNKIPDSAGQKYFSYRDMIRRDIEYAVKNDILKFEFEGEYNWRYLPLYAREEGYKITDRICQAKADELHLSNYRDGRLTIKNYLMPRSLRDGALRHIKITSRKKDDRIHVYCEIYPDAIDKIIDWFVHDNERKRKKLEEREKYR